MGIEGLWGLVQENSIKQSLKDFNIEYRFVKNYGNVSAPVVGVDASIMLDTFRAADREAGLNCVFYFDGLERPAVKRGRKVVHREPDFYKHARDLIELFGYYSFTAKGDADAELADLNRNGVIDAVLTKDSDVFPFGAVCVLRALPFAHKQSNELEVDVFNTVKIQTELGISRGGFILIALLLSNDITEGVGGIGAKTALSLAKSGFGDRILEAYHRYSTAAPQLSSAFQRINHDMANELEFDSHGKIGKRSPSRAQKIRESEFPSLGDLKGIQAFLTPPTSTLIPHCPPKLPDIGGITSFCREHFGWSSDLMRKKFHSNLWPAVIVQMLCSKSVAYNPSNAEILATQLEPIQRNIGFDHAGRPFIPTYSITINNKSLDAKNKKWTERISVTFSTRTLMQLAGLATDSISTRRMNVHAILISYALKNSYQNSFPALHTVPTSPTALASSSKSRMSLSDCMEEDIIEISDDE
ncbi:PIN domain-like protein [Lentinula raphanica]|nr:PIN domain-like protein [Lentinula raphanica]